MKSNDLTKLSDEELVQLSIEKADNYLILMKRYEKKLFWYILRISNVSKEDAEDILQEVFISVYKNLQGFDQTLKFSSWIYRITHNKTISHVRKIKTKPKTIDLEDGDIFDVIANSKDMDIEVHSKMEKERVISAIEEMDIKYKSVLILRFVEEKEYSEISDILKIPVNTVGTNINRAKKILKEKLN